MMSIYNLINNIFSTNILFVLILVEVMALYIFPKYYNQFIKSNYNARHKIHVSDQLKVGGAIVFSSFFLFIFASNFHIELGKRILLSALPIIVFGLKEDIYHNVGPKIRLFAIFLSSFLAIFSFSDIYLGYQILGMPETVTTFFLITFISFVVNGFNLIDGVNGLSASTGISSLLALTILSIVSSNYEIASMSILLIIFLIPFLFFNYPMSKIFLGDLGAYLLGFIISTLTLLLIFSSFKQSYIMLTICIYPITEVLFTLARRVVLKRHPFRPDKEHLHQLIFYFYRGLSPTKKFANNLVAPSLSLLVFYPLCVIFFSSRGVMLGIVSSLIFILLYTFVYRFFYKLKTKK